MDPVVARRDVFQRVGQALGCLAAQGAQQAVQLGDDLLDFVIALDMGAVFAFETGDQALVHELQHMLVPGRFGDHVVHHGEEFFAAPGFLMKLA
ncbi:hypothetical protein D3C84_1046220 [compost metagenome]